MRRFLKMTTGFFLSGLLTAQGPTRDSEFLDILRRELAFRELGNTSANVQREAARRQRAQYLEWQFITKMNRFVALWSALVREYNEKRVFNIKIAAEISKAFREIETSEGWPKPNCK